MKLKNKLITVMLAVLMTASAPAAVLADSGLPETSAVTMDAGTQESTVVYDLDQMEPFRGRTRDEVVNRFRSAYFAGAEQRKDSYYTRKASIKNPYDPGELNEGTLTQMYEATNFLRWLCGSTQLEEKCVNSDVLQAGALVRLFDFNHSVSKSRKPADMDDVLWDKGADAPHTIIAIGYTPYGSVIGWTNEGYDLSSNRWNTLGHRHYVVHGSYRSIQYGWVEGSAIGCPEGSADTYPDFTAFPGPGPFPSELINPYASAWSFDFSTGKARRSEGETVVTITNKRTGKVFTRTTADGSAKWGDFLLGFIQPDDFSKDCGYVDDYAVEISSGLEEPYTGNKVIIRYTVQFSPMEAEAGIYTPAESSETIDDSSARDGGSYEIEDSDEWDNMDLINRQGRKDSSIPAAKRLSVKGAKKRVTVRWKRLDRKKLKKISGIEIQICPNKRFARYCTKTAVVKKNKRAYTFRGLKKKSVYYVRVRNIRYVKGVKHVSRWSKAKKVRTR